VPNQFNAMRGVLSVLGLDQAAQAAQRMRDDVHAVLAQEAEASRATEQLADNLGALSFLIDMLGVQPQLAKSLFRFDPATGRFAAHGPGQGGGQSRPRSSRPCWTRCSRWRAAPGRRPPRRLSRHLEGLADQAVAADQPAVAQAVSQAREALAQAPDAQSAEATLAGVAQTLATLAAPPAVVPVPAPAEASDDDDDMREVFLEEAREVIDQAREALTQLGEAPPIWTR
jgi:chemosensory pili system protein ChpA (sensor histidine kinase/response regulator)